MSRGSILSPKERRQVRQDHGLGLAAEHVADPRRGVVRLRLHPVVGPDGGRQCLACFRRAAGSELGHGQRQPRTGAVGEECRRLFQQRHGLLRSALTILRQSPDEQGVSIVRKELRSGGHGPVHERDRASELLPGSRQEQAGQAVALGHGPVVGAVSGAFEEGLAGPAVRFLVAEECAKRGVAVPGVVIRRRRFQLLLPRGHGPPPARPLGPGPWPGPWRRRRSEVSGMAFRKAAMAPSASPASCSARPSMMWA